MSGFQRATQQRRDSRTRAIDQGLSISLAERILYRPLVSPGVAFSKAGATMNPSTVFCENCGAANQPQAGVCLVCGQAMLIPTPVAPVEKPVMTTLHSQGYS